jgi:glycosyltransferase involved in cell wall biosynthesis
MRIMFLIRSLNKGGAERQLISLAVGLKECGHVITVAVFYPGGILQEKLTAYGVPVISLNKRGRWDIFRFLVCLVRTVRSESPEILHAYLGTSNILSVLLKPLFPRCRIIWGMRASNLDLDCYDWFFRVLYRIECILSRFADLIIANSRAGKAIAIARGIPKHMIVVIPNGVDTQHFKPDSKVRARLRSEWGIRDDEILIGLVGRLDPMKDHPTFIKAAALLARQRRDVRFACVGDGPVDYTQKLHAFAHQLGLNGKLIWVGARDNMPAVYNAFDVASSSSRGEGFSNVIGEAMACGVPCVVTDVGDSARIVGDTGVVVPPRDPIALAHGLKTALENDLNVNSTRQRVMAQFSLKRLLRRTEETLDYILEKVK